MSALRPLQMEVAGDQPMSFHQNHAHHLQRPAEWLMMEFASSGLAGILR